MSFINVTPGFYTDSSGDIVEVISCIDNMAEIRVIKAMSQHYMIHVCNDNKIHKTPINHALNRLSAKRLNCYNTPLAKVLRGE